MNTDKNKKLLIFTIILYAILNTVATVFMYVLAAGKDFPSNSDMLYLLLIQGFLLLPLIFSVTLIAKKANAKVWRIISTIYFYEKLATLVIFIIAFILLGISNRAQIEDINGAEDTSLAVIDTAEILSTQDDFKAFSRSSSFSGWSTDVTGDLQKYDWHECTFSSNKISGIKTLQATETNSQQLKLRFDSTLKQGNMEILVIVDGQYYDSIPVNQKYTMVIDDVSGKTVVVKIAAESADMKVTVTRQIDNH